MSDKKASEKTPASLLGPEAQSAQSEEEEKAKQEFELVPKETEKFVFLAECAKLLTTGNVWTKEQDIVFQSHCTLMSPIQRALSFWIPKQLDLEKLKSVLKTQPDFFINLAHPGASLFFKTKIRSLDSANLIFEVPEKLYRVQRRHSFRLPMRGVYSLTVDFENPQQPNQMLTKRVFDLSDLGMAFLIYTQDEPQFAKGTILRKFSFVLSKQTVTMEAEVRYTKPLGKESRDLSKVGVKFKSVSQEDSWLIASYVLAENRRFVSSTI